MYKIPDINKMILYRKSTLIPDAISEMARLHPNKIAIIDRKLCLNYQQLDKLTNKIAHYLLERGFKKSDVIVIYGYRNYILVLSIIAIMKIGAIFSILDPKYPSAYIEKCITAVKPKGLLNTGLLMHKNILKEKLTTISMSKLNKIIAGSLSTDQKEVDVSLEQNDTAVITFTSGTTALPKVVEGRHSSLTHFYPWMNKVFGPFSHDNFAMCSNIGHDPLQRDIFTPLFFAATLFIPSDKDIFSPGQLIEWLYKNNITVCCFTPSMLQLLCTFNEKNRRLEQLRLVFFVGECLLRLQVEQLMMIAPNARVVNLYGSTETQRAVSYFEVPKKLKNLPDIIPVGKGMPGVDVIILNPNSGKQCNYQEIGEIYIRSPWIAKGYLHAPKEDEARFSRVVGSNNQNDYMYRTGDMGFYDKYFGVRCMGRIDDQVKINGHRIELQYINNILRQFDSSINNAVTLVHKKSNSLQLIAFVTLYKKGALNNKKKGFSQKIRIYLKNKLPGYMVPEDVIVIDAMPLTPNGKTNLKALDELYTTRQNCKSQDELNYSESSSKAKILLALKKKIAKICKCNLRQVDGLRHVSDYNISSLFLLELLSFICNLTNRNFSMDMLDGNPTINQLAENISNRQTHNSKSSVKSKAKNMRFWLKDQSVQKVSENHIYFNKKKFLHFCSNSYLGMSNNHRLKQAIFEGIETFGGIGSHGSPLLNGNTIIHEELQETIAKNYNCKQSVLFGSAYMANISAIPSIAKHGDSMFIDECCHRSMIDGCCLSGGSVHVFKHNDINELEDKLKSLKNVSKNKFILTEGVFSMEGDICDLPALRFLADKYGAILIVDEACSFGQIGKTGKGTEEYFNMPGTIDIRIGTLSKAIPSIGGYVATNKEYANCIRLQRGAVYSGALPIIQAKIALEALKIMCEDNTLIKNLQHNAEIWRMGLQQMGLDIMKSATAIVPIKTFNLSLTKYVSHKLLKAGIYTFPITHPWIEHGCERIRTTVTAAHTNEQIHLALSKMQTIAGSLTNL